MRSLRTTAGVGCCGARWTCLMLAIGLLGGCLRHGNSHSGDAQVTEDGSADGTPVDLAGADLTSGDLSGLDLSGTDVIVDPGHVASSGELIREALETGTIDEKTAALYELLAQFSPDRLPPAYHSDLPLGTLPSVAPMRIARAHIDEYSATEAAAVNAMLASPDDPEWLVFPADMPVQNAGTGAGACRAGFSTATPGAHVIGTATDTKHFRIKAIAAVGASAADKAALVKRLADGLKSNTPGVGGTGNVTFGVYLDQVYEYYLNDQKMKDPSKLAGPAANGGLIPIYVAMCDGQTNDAFAEPNDGFIFVSVGIGFEDATLRRVVIPHEVFHVFQNAFDIPAVSRDWSWVGDASAVAAEDLVAPDVRRWSGSLAASANLPAGFGNPMARSFQCPEEPLHTDYVGKCKNRAGGAKQYDGAYSKFVVFKFLMRNKGLTMGEFFTNLKAAGGDPRELFNDQAMGELQLALMGDVAGQTPYFDASDRAEFYVSGRKSVDLDAGDAERYTYRMNPSSFGNSVGYRIPPTLDSSLSQTLKKLDNTSQPIQPGGGTQRILLEIPDSVASIPAGSCGVVFAFRTYFEFANCTECTVNMVAVSPSGTGPGRSFDASSDDSDTLATPYAITYKQWNVDEGGSIPRFLLAVITNHGSAAATFKAGVSVEQACTHDCMDEYEQIMEGMQCPEFWCEDDCVDAGTCKEWYENCLAAYKDQLPGMPGTFCIYLCDGNGYPYVEETDPECRRWQKSTCDASGVADCKTIPSIFVPIPTWPTARCQTFMTANPEECP